MPSAKAIAAAKAKGEEEAVNQLSGASIKDLRDTASDVVKKMRSSSILLNKEAEECLSIFDIKELSLGNVLGRGGFCVVNEIRSFNLDESDNLTKDQKQDSSFLQKEYHTREAMAQRCIREGGPRYAVKKLSTDCKSSPGLFLKGTIDLAIESRFLSAMSHPHLIKMRAVANVDPFHEDYFIILDRLYDTLETMASKWKSKEKKTKGLRGSIFNGKSKAVSIRTEKMIAIHDISSAMLFMHKLNVIYRDLKPENIGFDIRGEVKLFDLGLAKELKDSDRNEDGTYKLTGFTGSLRYMAPEVAKSLPYNFSADVYSFAMVFWQIMANEPPFDSYSCKLHEDRVVNKGYRPVCGKNWPNEWSNLMKKCWNQNPKKRPSFEEISQELSTELDKFNDLESDIDRLDISQKSYMGN